MNRVNVLDCTLRDGGYINNWKFGKNNIDNLVNKISLSNVEIIELGFITDAEVFGEDYSKFNSLEEINGLKKDTKNNLYVGMINFGEFPLEKLPKREDSSIDGIRVVFHRKDYKEALEYCREVKALGYLTFIQPMVTLRYTDKELIQMINEVNEIMPYAFYIVDSFGVMKRNDLLRLFYLYDHNLDEGIQIGYHSHNNLQLAFSNAQSLLDIKSKRNLIIDSSTFGMGRGAGNLNTELFLNYLNDNFGKNYDVQPLSEAIDEVLNEIYVENYWGYSLPHFLSSVRDCHPNYATYLSGKNTLNVSSIADVLNLIADDKRDKLDIDYIESLYDQYVSNDVDDSKTMKTLEKVLENKKIYAIAPGSNSKDFDYDSINREESIVISINHIPKRLQADYVFFSNEKRYSSSSLELLNGTDVILTSNLVTNGEPNVVNYNSLVNKNNSVKDNSGLMLIKLLMSLDIKQLNLIGMDGYSYKESENYKSDDLTFVNTIKEIDSLNENIKVMIDYFDNFIDLVFLTESKYK